MPITQSRMLDLLHAAQDFQQAFDDMFRYIGQQRERVEQQQITKEQAFDNLAFQVKPEYMLSRPMESPVTVLLETKHFSMFARKNEKSAKWQRSKREALAIGAPPPEHRAKTAHSNTAPAHIIARTKQRPTVHTTITAMLDENGERIETRAERVARIDAEADSEGFNLQSSTAVSTDEFVRVTLAQQEWEEQLEADKKKQEPQS